MANGPYTSDEAGIIVGPFIEHGIEVIISGRWAIDAYLDGHPSENSEEHLAWRKKNPPDGPLNLACRFDDRTMIESILVANGFEFRSESDYSETYENHRGEVVELDFFRPARDGGRIYPKLVHDEDWYYSPQTVSFGRLGSVLVRTEAPIGDEMARTASPRDEA